MNVFDSHLSKQQSSGAEKAALRRRIQEQQNPTGGTSMCILLMGGVSMAGCLIYTWDNPDDHQCYFYNDKALTRDEYNKLITFDQHDAINVSRQFKMWFMSGVILCSMFVFYSIWGFIFQCTNRFSHAKIANCFLILGYFLNLAWFISGAVLRWRDPGSACSGDNYTLPPDFDYSDPKSYNPYLLKTGTIMVNVLIIMMTFYSCMCCCGTCACIAVACGYRRELN